MTSATGSWIVIAILIFVAVILVIGVFYWTFIYEYTGQLKDSASKANLPPPPPNQPPFSGS